MDVPYGKFASLPHLITISICLASAWSQLSPFFFLCNYHGPAQNYGLDRGDVVVSVNIEGNPRGYVPGDFYNISISSSETFDSLLMTGLYTTKSSISSPSTRGEISHGSRDVMCSIIHSQVSPRPMRKLTFTWMAPPEGTGCVNFLATATHGQQLLFKDTSIAQLCEQGALSSQSMRPELAEVNTDSFLMRDDFDSDPEFSSDIWAETNNGEIGDECGTLVNGNSAVFCGQEGNRRLVTVPLNLTSAHVLQFFLGGGKCRSHEGKDQNIVVGYGHNECTDWTPIQRISAPTSSQPEMHVITLPLKARQPDTCIVFYQPSNTGRGQEPFWLSKEPPPFRIPELPDEILPSVAPTILTETTEGVVFDESITSTSIPSSTTTLMFKTTATTKTAPTTSSTIEATNTPTKTESLTLSTTTATTLKIPTTKKTTATTTITVPAATTIAIPTRTTIPTTTTPPSTTTTTKVKPASTTTKSTTTRTGRTTATTKLFITEEQTGKESTQSSTEEATAAADATSFQPTIDLVYPTSPENSPFTTKYPFPIIFLPRDQPQADQSQVDDVPYHGCWAIDNIVIVNTANPPQVLEEDFDPIDPSDWIFFPGANVDHQCQSHGNAFIFADHNQTLTHASTRDLDLDVYNISVDAYFLESFESSDINGMTVTEGRVGSQCGIVRVGNAMIFDGAKKRSTCTPEFELKDVGSARFYLKFGGEYGCKADRESSPVLVYLEDEENNTVVMNTLEARDFLVHSSVVTQPFDRSSLRGANLHGRVKLCLLQKSHRGAGVDVWAVDDIALLPSSSDVDKVFQASVNLNCQSGVGGNKGSAEVSVEYSTDHGANWLNLYSPCLPGTCDTGKYSALTSYFSGKDNYGWDRLTLPIPYAAQTPHTRFRIVQLGSQAGQWALDDVYIGSCEGWCSGHGMCTTTGCSCDFGFEGSRCEKPTSPAPSNLQETFEDRLVISASGTLDVSGGSIGYLCGVVASGKAMVFNQAGPRGITTADLDTEAVSHVQFTMRVGSQSVKSSCPPPDQPWEMVLLEASCNGGTTWALLGQYGAAEYSRPMSVSTPLPPDARGLACRLRWRQPQHSGLGKDVWAIDDLSFMSIPESPVPTSGSGNEQNGGGRGGGLTVLDVEMMDSPILDDRLTSNLGQMEDSFCRRMRSLKFSGPETNGEARTLKTKVMRVGPGYIAQFDLVMGCGVPYNEHLDNQVYFLYSVDHGISWQLVKAVCLPPSVCSFYSGGSVYHHTQFEDWHSVTVTLPSDTWGQHTKFQWVQPEWAETDVWAVSRVYIGQACPKLCNGHGDCHMGACRCQKGYSGESCEPDGSLDSSIRANFGHRYDPRDDFYITGGEVVRSDEGCGMILSGENLFFDQDGVREILTKDLNTEAAHFIQFWVQVGGDGRGEKCSGADRRSESVLLRFSTDGGINWSLLSELDHREHRSPTFVHLELPNDAKGAQTRFQWWQPEHSGKGTDQWAIDQIMIGNYTDSDVLEDDFSSFLDPMDSGNWRVITEGATGKYCGRFQPSLVMSNQVNDKLIISQNVRLNPGDVLQFEINVDCGKLFSWNYPVFLQHSHDEGHTWSLVTEPCYLEQDCDGKLTEASIYHTGTFGQWSMVVIPITERIAANPVIFRWWQPGGVDHSFSIDSVYIGPPCPNHCHRRGVCSQGQCQCFETQIDGIEVTEPDCQPTSETPQGMLDRFDNQNMPMMEFWGSIANGNVFKGCGVVDSGDSLYFSGDGPREARTVGLNVTAKSILEVSIKIGDKHHSRTCKPGLNRDEGVIMDFSTDNGITWTVLKFVEPMFETVRPATVLMDLPPEAKTERTIFRFWQPLGHGGMPRAEWAIDSVLVGINETSRPGFEDKFSEMTPDPYSWFLADAATPWVTCGSHSNALEFSHKNGYQIAETWDYTVTPSTFLQFDLAMNCGSLTYDLYDILLQYSTDHGRTWHPVTEECTPPSFECAGYHRSSSYPSTDFGNWTRVTVAMPEGAISPKTRFRWMRAGEEKPNPIWAIDNVYLGSDCPWLCSGHGVCQQGKCVCDYGFGGEFCVATKSLPMSLKDDFNSAKPNPDVWSEVQGGVNSLLCGPVVADRSLTFEKNGHRIAVTNDMDTTMVTHIEFHFRYGCGSENEPWPRSYSVLLQYSTTGGIKWTLVREIHFHNTSETRYYSIPLPMEAKHNATRFRFWQAANAGALGSVWAVDNLFIGPMNTRPSTLFDVFQADSPGADDLGGGASDFWTFINNGQLDEFCNQNKRDDHLMSQVDNSALVFRRNEEGEISAVTSDLDLGPMSVIQFDLNVGCGAAPREKYPVRLEYSTDGGVSWDLVSPDCVQEATASKSSKPAASVAASCFDSKLPPTVYYAGETDSWRRAIVPLDHIRVCGPIRFRWYQGKIPTTDFAPEWAIDNVYIGMACMEHCNGHGYCIAGMMCQCDKGYSGPLCVPDTSLSSYLKDGFDQPLSARGAIPSPEEKNWQIWSSGLVTSSHQCGQIFSGSNFVQSRPGLRALTTVPLDLSKASTIQFHIRLGCNGTIKENSPSVYLQYSNNGGIYWTTIQQFEFSQNHPRSRYIALHVPSGARHNATQIRWWQPSESGKYTEDWAIDQVYIGGNIDGERMLLDDPYTPLNTTWLEHRGARLEQVCDSEQLALHFTGKEKDRYATTADVKVSKGSVLQFDLAMGCDEIKSRDKPCFILTVQYSLDKGVTWHLLAPACRPSMPECGQYRETSSFNSDVNVGWRTITIPIPQRAWSSQTRFRLYQASNSDPDQTWAIKQLYVGSECPSSCQGHGHCRDMECVCHKGWSGFDCSAPTELLPDMLVEDFLSKVYSSQWERVVGGDVLQPCRPIAFGEALHFTGPCSRLLETIPLDVTTDTLIQFNFMYGCKTGPNKRDNGVLVEYSTDGGIHWITLSEMHFHLYKIPTFVSLVIPEAAKSSAGTKFRWKQPEHDGVEQSDWLIDNIRINGDPVNPNAIAVNFTSDIDFVDIITADGVDVGEYCGKESVAVGQTPLQEISTLTTRDVIVRENNVVYFDINVGCGQPWDAHISPVTLSFSSDHGMTWTELIPPCQEHTDCKPFSRLARIHHHGTHDNWRRVTIPLSGLPVSNGTRFRWQQRPNGMPEGQDWAMRNIYVGKACPSNCNGRGRCHRGQCLCDSDYSGTACEDGDDDNIMTEVKDPFDASKVVSDSKWPWVQGGQTQLPPCGTLVSDQALVMNGPGAREVVSPILDLRDARFIQYAASMWTREVVSSACQPSPEDKAQSVYLQVSIDGGVNWQTLHTLSPSRYASPRRDYIPLPAWARTNNSIVRWIQDTGKISSPRIHWALDDVYIGGREINPYYYNQNFDSNPDYPNDDGSGQQDDADAWEFSPYGVLGLQGNPCGVSGSNGGSAMVFMDHVGADGITEGDEGIRVDEHHVSSFTTNQLIVQAGYTLQFKLIVGCGQHQDICSAPTTPVRLEYRRDPSSEQWLDVQASCLPGTQGKEGLCNPLKHHHPSHFSLSDANVWTRVTIDLNDVISSSTTQFRWIQDGSNCTVMWAVDDIYIGESCPDMCRGRGDCIQGVCRCDENYIGPTCSPRAHRLPTRLFDSFEGGVFPSHWAHVKGGGLGFGCGALLPFAHGKTLYFNGCGTREAVTSEMDTTHAIKIIFVIQIGCYAQTHDCNIELTEGPSYKGVLLQYSTNMGADWYFIAQHDTTDFLRPKKVAYDIPLAAKALGTQFRWWQPSHGGHGFDQWAIDHVEIISGGRRNHRRRGWRRRY